MMMYGVFNETPKDAAEECDAVRKCENFRLKQL